MAQEILDGLKEKAATAGIPLDVGETHVAFQNGEEEDPQRLVGIVAHAVARIGDRFSFLRRFSRHMEGAEKRAGILTDITAAAYELYKRNPDTFTELGKGFARDLRERQAQRRAIKTAEKASNNADRNGSASQAEQTPTQGVS